MVRHLTILALLDSLQDSPPANPQHGRLVNLPVDPPHSQLVSPQEYLQVRLVSQHRVHQMFQQLNPLRCLHSPPVSPLIVRECRPMLQPQ